MFGILGTMLSAWRRFYGANPLHLIILLVGAALVGYTASFVATEPMAVRMLIWFLGALVVHDLVLFPLYALADRSLLVGRRARRRLTRRKAPLVPAINHLRVPMLGSGLLLVVFFPVIAGQGESAYVTATGMTTDPYFQRWLVVSAVMFAASAVIYAARVVVVAARLREPAGTPAQTVRPPVRDTDSARAEEDTTQSEDDVPARQTENTPPGQNLPSSARPETTDRDAAQRVEPAPDRATVDEQRDTGDPKPGDGRGGREDA